MSVRRTLTRALELLAVVVLVSLIVSQFLGQPVLLAFVETGSMAPTTEPSGGCITIA
jgi:signal peptidase